MSGLGSSDRFSYSSFHLIQQPIDAFISVNRMCQENAGAEQSHKRSGQFKHGNHLILRADPGGFIKVGVSG